MSSLGQFAALVRLQLLMNRGETVFVGLLQVVLTLGFVIGFGYVIPDVSEKQALYLTTGTATNALVMVALVGLPMSYSLARAEGRLEYMLALPLSREILLAAQVTSVAVTALPGVGLAVALGAWHYGLPLAPGPALIAVIPLSIISLAGVGVAIGMLSPQPNLTNLITNMTVFYVLLFAPVLIPRDQLPAVLRAVSVVMPPTYAADATRAALTDLPDTHLARSLLMMAGFSVLSLGLAAAAMRRRA